MVKSGKTCLSAELQLQVDAVAYGGKGIARVGGPSGKVYFVEDAVPGDVVKARITEDGDRYGEATVVERLSASPLRGPQACPFADACGGCQWMGIDYGEQLAWKRGFVEGALRRIGKLDTSVPVRIEPAPDALAYRSRVLVRVHHAGEGCLVVGYFARGTRRLVPIDRCRIAAPEVDRIVAQLARADVRGLAAFKARLEIQGLPPQAPSAASGAAVTVYPAEGERATLDDFVMRLRELPGVVWAGTVGELRAAPAFVLERDLGLTFRTTPGQFQQVNQALNRTLRRLVKEVVDQSLGDAPARLLDVFCGSGNLSLPLAGPGRYVEGIEANRQAVAVGQQNVEAERLSGVSYLTGDAEKHLWKCARGGERFDLILLDPPRQGMYQGMVPLKKLAPTTIVYVSCDPTTLARDLGYLCRKDAYRIESVTALDFFPNTYHVETVVVLKRQGSRPSNAADGPFSTASNGR